MTGLSEVAKVTKIKNYSDYDQYMIQKQLLEKDAEMQAIRDIESVGRIKDSVKESKFKSLFNKFKVK